MRRSIKVCYYVTTAASKIAVNWIQLCYNLRMVTCAFFTNLTIWKFPYENRLVEISRESYDILAYELCPSIFKFHGGPHVLFAIRTIHLVIISAVQLPLKNCVFLCCSMMPSITTLVLRNMTCVQVSRDC